ncbi:MOB kinase activator-like 1 [Tritrichomonas foetus]|uniref:MOB kinase activator-like 1 n=1 Tax=Tritrichomonas foetus TaxID=1144522 RepID=A0A1J4JPT7_9EUKA|nr:MOB kinase activator-like 1 [Tritrichomonas foetus]|eukprot:OHS99541.1 MOB kinase activator-like 1 [Tritrichomonas foetus]
MFQTSHACPNSRSNSQIFKSPKHHHLSKKQRRSYGNYKVHSMPQIDLQQAVKLPEGEDLFEWLAKNINDFYRQVSMLFSVMTEFCTNERCCTMSAGPGYRYLWSDEKNPTPAEVTAPEYLTKLLKWIDGLLEDETVFPSTLNVQFPDDFMSIVKNIMKRLFRFYAHCYYHHIDDFHYLKMSSLLDTSFKHFILFTHEFDLIPPDQLEPLRDLIDLILKA